MYQLYTINLSKDDPKKFSKLIPKRLS